MDFQILGPLEVHRNGCSRWRWARRSSGLCSRSCWSTRTSSSPSDRLIEELWPEPPGTAVNALQVYVGKLRKALEPDRARGSPGELLITRAPGYVLRVEPDELDADRFERLLTEGRSARHANDPEAATALLRQALDLWRGPALADFGYDPFAQAEIARLEELRLDAVEERIDAELSLGAAGELVSELETLTRENPLRERLRGQLMLALYRSGRQADALEVYQADQEDAGRRAWTQAESIASAPTGGHPAPRAGTRGLDRGARQWSVGEVASDSAADSRRAKDRHGPGRSPARASAAWIRRPSTAKTSAIATTSGGPCRNTRGLIASSLGDEVMAVFGVPQAHEDDAFRAACAAVEIRDGPAAG